MAAGDNGKGLRGPGNPRWRWDVPWEYVGICTLAEAGCKNMPSAKQRRNEQHTRMSANCILFDGGL